MRSISSADLGVLRTRPRGTGDRPQSIAPQCTTLQEESEGCQRGVTHPSMAREVAARTAAARLAARDGGDEGGDGEAGGEGRR